ncbi:MULTISPECIES: chemotaxis protein CheW [Thermoanaerobacter]
MKFIRIEEITKYETPIKIPGMPSYIEGVINLR